MLKSKKTRELAKKIAAWLTNIGTQKTISGNYHFEFEEVNEQFGTNLPQDKSLLNAIEDSFDYNIVADVCLDEDFDLLFWLAYCPNHEEDCYEV